MERLILHEPAVFNSDFWIGGSHSKSWALTLDDYRTFPAGEYFEIFSHFWLSLQFIGRSTTS